MKLGTDAKPYHLWFDNHVPFKVGQIITFNPRRKVEVIKVYKTNWYRKLLRKLGFKIRVNQIKVKNI